MEKTTEEKARLYDEAVKKIQESLDQTADSYKFKGTLTKEDLKEIAGRYFPEFYEPYNVKVKRKLRTYLEKLVEDTHDEEKVEEYVDFLRWVENRKDEWTLEDRRKLENLIDEMGKESGVQYHDEIIEDFANRILTLLKP